MKIKHNLIPLMLMLLIPIINITYFCLNSPLGKVHSLVTTIDKEVPFISLFVIPYVIWYPFVFLSLIYLCFYDKKIYFKSLATMITGMIICYILYYFFQTTVPRPSLSGNDFCTTLVKMIYNFDNPFNCFPSIHVLNSCVIMEGINRSNSKKGLKVIVNLIAVLIMLSTQFIKQHVILDLIFSVVLARSLYSFINILDLELIRKRFLLWMTKKKLEI